MYLIHLIKASLKYNWAQTLPLFNLLKKLQTSTKNSKNTGPYNAPKTASGTFCGYFIMGY